MTPDFPVHVEKRGPGDYRIDWHADFSTGHVEIHVHARENAARHTAPLLRAAGPGADLRGLPEGRQYFFLRPENGVGLEAAERGLTLEHGTNFRDLGGYRTDDGRRVRWGRLYRSGHTAKLTPRDREDIAALDIRVCCEFRRSEEQAADFAGLPEGIRCVDLEILPGNHKSFFDMVRSGLAKPEDLGPFMRGINRQFALDSNAQYRRMFEELLALSDGSFLIKCAAGKDRTGFGAAMILSALGVPRHTVFADYLLTQRYYPIEREMARIARRYQKNGDDTVDVSELRPMMEARAEYLQAAFDAIDAEYASVERYLEEALGVGPAERRLLRDRLTV